MIRRAAASLALVVSFACAAGCAREERAAESMQFRVDEARLGARWSDPATRVEVRAPAGWEGLPDSMVAAAMERVGPADGGPRLVALYRQEPEGAALAVSRYPAALAPERLDSLAAARLAALRSAHPGARVEDGRFSYRGFEIVQFRTVDTTQVAFQLIVRGAAPPLLQLDYLVPRSVYSREMESVESSIGSLSSPS